jgi:outer membrane immunogenic protein
MRTRNSAGKFVQLAALGAAMWLTSSPLSQTAAQGVEINFNSGAASASEPVGPVFKPTPWDGLYFGGSLGYQWTGVAASDTYTFASNPAASASGNFTGSGFLGSVQAGYNMQKTSLVYGLEADLGYLNISGSQSRGLNVAKSGDSLNASYSSRSSVYGDVTARAGVTVGKFLFYAKGGVAALDAEFGADYNGQGTGVKSNCLLFCTKSVASSYGSSGNGILWGWTAGAGGEYSLTSSISAKLEYQHFDFASATVSHNGTSTSSGYVTALSGSANFSPTIDVVKLGLNYRLN